MKRGKRKRCRKERREVYPRDAKHSISGELRSYSIPHKEDIKARKETNRRGKGGRQKGGGGGGGEDRERKRGE